MLAGEPGQEVEDSFEYGYGDRRHHIRERPLRIDGRDTALGGGLESGGRLEGVAPDIVRESDIVVTLAEVPAADDNLLTVPGCKVGRDSPRSNVVQKVLALQFLD